MDKLKALRERLKNKNDSSKFRNNSGGYEFWNIPFGEKVKVRFLPDADESNDDYLWRESWHIDLPFPGVLGGNEDKEVKVRVPCIKGWGREYTCPVLNEISGWWKPKGDEESHEEARKYNARRKYIFQGFVVDNDPLLKDGDDAPENPIRKWSINKSLFDIIKSTIEAEGDDDELEDFPGDFDNGLDFIIRREKKGEWADYSSSSWARKTRSLTEEEREAIDKFGLFKLADFLPKKPTEEDLEIIKQMFEASVEGELYDPSLWGNHYKPFGLNLDSADSSGSKKSKSKDCDDDVDLSKPMEIEDNDESDETSRKSKAKKKDKADDGDEEDSTPPKKKKAAKKSDDEDSEPPKKKKADDDEDKPKPSGKDLLAAIRKKREAEKAEEDD